MQARAVIVALLAVTSAACTLQQIRRHTYPPDFHYITREEVHGTMAELAVEIVELEQIMEQQGGPGPEDRVRVVEILSRMDALAQGLKTGGRSNHPRIDRAAPWLQDDIRRALRDARALPPTYYFAGQVSGACSYCHVPRHRIGSQPASSG